MARYTNGITQGMESANNNGRPKDYNRGGKENNDSGLLNPASAKMLSRLISLRAFRLLAEADGLGTDGLVSTGWPDMPGVAREYQAAAAGGLVRVDEAEGFGVMAAESGDDPVITFEEKPPAPDGFGPGGFDDLPFV